MTALHTAAMHGNKEFVSFLLDKGANIWATDSRQNTALHLAAKNGHLDIVKRILERNGMDHLSRYSLPAFNEAEKNFKFIELFSIFSNEFCYFHFGVE